MKTRPDDRAIELEEAAGQLRPSGGHGAFTKIRSVPIDSLNLTVEEYRHEATGAVHYHLTAANPENVFLVACRTVPTDSTGVAHILEHTALCGSERYPVRDPFFMMIRRSLNTFMNAFTSSDWTAYPFASQNRKDFDNLFDVYLDAVFFSRLHELDFAQEGHRVEFATPDDPTTPLVLKGVVFNEMKGAMSSPVSVLWQALSEHMFDTTTYHFNSGGDPARIPDLSYDALESFYRSHYHPSNAIFMTYGDIPAHEHQSRLHERALARFERLDTSIEVADEQRFNTPRAVEEVYALDAAEAAGDKTHIVIGWLLGRSTDAMERMKAHLLCAVLLDNGACPLRYALETTELGAAPSPLCGLEDSNREMVLVCGVEGSSPERAEAVERLVLDVVERVAEEGIAKEQVEAALHQLELHQREIGGDHMPYGLQLILSALPAAIHRADPVALLDIDPTLERLRAAIDDPGFIKGLARELILGNRHRVRLTLRPDTELSAHRERGEAERLVQLKATMSETEKVHVVARSARLAERQSQEDDPEILPKVTLADVPATIRIPQEEPHWDGDTSVAAYAQGTNGLVYHQLVVDLPQLEDRLLDALPHYTVCLTEVGCGERDYLEAQAWQDAVSGGIEASTTVRGAVDDEQRVSGHFTLAGKALVRNHAKLGDLMHETFERPHFDEHARIREVLAIERARAEQSVTGNGHRLAMMAATSAMSPQAALAHRLDGLAGIHALKALDERITRGDGDVEELCTLLAELHDRVRHAPRQLLLIGEREHHGALLEGLERFWAQPHGADGFIPFSLAATRARSRQLWLTSTQVNFCAKAYPSVPAEHPDAPALMVLGHFLRNGYLHRAIREQGGAYGVGAGQDSDVAAFRFFSYRDPRLEGTLADFDEAIQWLLGGGHEWHQVEEAILGVVGALDKPGSPAGDAEKAFYDALHGRSAEQRQRLRARVLEVKLEDLQHVAERYLEPERASVAIIANPSTRDRAGDLGLEVREL